MHIPGDRCNKLSLFSDAHFPSSQAFAQEVILVASSWKIPLESKSRTEFGAVRPCKGGGFMAKRHKHLHTGIDISNQKPGEKVFAASTGKVISIYAGEPNKAIMIQHKLVSGEDIWTTYVHVTDIQIQVGELVTSNTIIARLMSKIQLNEYGWVYNHLHFEILKKPRVEKSGKILSYSTRCRTREDVERHFFDPIKFLEKTWVSDKLD